MTPDPLPETKADDRGRAADMLRTLASKGLARGVKVDLPTPEDKDRQRRAADALRVPPEGKWANPRPYGMGRHTKRFLDGRTGEVVLVKSTATPFWVKRRDRKAKRKAQTVARRANRG